MNAVIIIPALNPDKELPGYINGLIEKVKAEHIIVVDDGSDKEYRNIFSDISKLKECDVLYHKVNQGKGAALKDAFRYYQKNYGNSRGGGNYGRCRWSAYT